MLNQIQKLRKTSECITRKNALKTINSVFSICFRHSLILLQMYFLTVAQKDVTARWVRAIDSLSYRRSLWQRWRPSSWRCRRPFNRRSRRRVLHFRSRKRISRLRSNKLLFDPAKSVQKHPYVSPFILNTFQYVNILFRQNALTI